MNIQEKKHIVQKLLSGTLSEEEKARLSQSPEMEQIWLQQWEQASDRSQEVNPDQLWAGIRQQTGQKNRPWKSYFYKWYSPQVPHEGFYCISQITKHNFYSPSHSTCTDSTITDTLKSVLYQ